MNTKITRYLKLTIITLICSLFSSNASAQVTNLESFETTTFLPSGWSAVGSTTLWSRRTTGGFPSCNPLAGVGMVRLASRGQTPGTNQTIATPSIDYSNRGSNSAYISFFIYRDNGSVNGDSISVYVNGSVSLTGATHIGTVARYTKLSVPDTQAQNGWYKYTFNVPSSFTGSTNYILIKGISQNGFNIFLDEIEWNSFPNQCTGKPSAGLITATNTFICNGGGNTTLTLNNQSTGALGLSIQWKNSNNINGPYFNVGPNNASFNTGNINTTQFYKAVISCSYSGLSDSTTPIKITVKSSPYPTVLVSPTNANFCVGTIGAKLIASGASTYTWTPSTALSATNSDTVYANPTTTTTYTVRGTDTAGCAATFNVSVTPRQGPFVTIVSPDTNMCSTDSVQLTAQTGGGGNSYSWSPAGRNTQSIYAKPNSTTKYTVTVTNGFGCKNTSSKTVEVHQQPKAKFEVNIVNRTYQFIDSSLNAQSVYYDFGDGNSSTNRNPIYTYSFTGSKTIMMVAYNPPCGNDTIYRTFNVSSIKGVKTSNFNIFPNPANNTVHVELNDHTSADISICDISGRVVLQRISNSNSIDLDISDLSEGLYFIKSGDSTELLTIKR